MAKEKNIPVHENPDYHFTGNGWEKKIEKGEKPATVGKKFVGNGWEDSDEEAKKKSAPNPED